MSTGKCQNIDQYLFILRQVLDGESSRGQEDYLLQHLDSCACCLEAYELEKHVRELLHARFEHRELPPGLESSIKAKILKAASYDR